MAICPVVIPPKSPAYCTIAPDYSAVAVYKNGDQYVQFDIQDTRKELPVKEFQGKQWVLWKFKVGYTGEWERYALHDEWQARLQKRSG